MSDLTKVVQKLTETNAKLAILERQNNESGSVKELIKAALPEILNDNKNVKFQDKEEAKRDTTSGTQFGKAQEPRKLTTERLSENTDTINLQSELLEEQHQNEIKLSRLQTELLMAMGDQDEDRADDIRLDIEEQQTKHEQTLEAIRDSAPIPPTPAKIEEDEKDKVKSLAAALSKSSIGKGILGIGKSIGGFIGGLASTAKGGALMFLKGIIAASALGLIIMFLKSDVFKEFLSKKNLRKLFKFFGDMKVYFKEAFDFIADPNNRKSIAYALGIAAFAKMGGLSLIGGTLMALGGLFSLGGIFGKKAITDANASIAKTKKGGGLGKFTKFLKAGALIGLGIAAFDGIKAAQDSYMKGNPFGKIVADSVGEIVKSLTFGIVDAQKISEFLSPSDSIKVAKKEADIRLLEKSIDADGTTTAIKTLKEKKIEQLKSELETFKKDSQKRADLKVKKQDERSAQEEFDIKRKNFIAEGKAADRILGKGLSISERREIGILTSGNFAERKYGKKFDEKFGQQNPQLKLDAKVIKLRNDKRMSDKEEMEKLLADREKKDKLLLGGRTNTFGSTNITNNIVNADQSNNSKSEVKINQGKGVKPSFDFADAFVTSY